MTVKSVMITGGAAQDLSPRGRRRTAKRKNGDQLGGDAGGAMMQMAAGSTGAINVSKLVGSVVNAEGPMPLASFAKPLNPMLGGSTTYVGGSAYPAAANAIPMGPALAPGPGTGVPLGSQLGPAVAAMTTAASAMADQKGGTVTIKVELKKNATQKKVHLNPRKETVHVHKKDKTRRHRKITLGLVGMQKRLTRAKKIQKKVKEMPIGDLKAELIKRNLIKSTSKAPESVLRQIAADAHIVARQDL
jgi:hypothetical protein